MPKKKSNITFVAELIGHDELIRRFKEAQEQYESTSLSAEREYEGIVGKPLKLHEGLGEKEIDKHIRNAVIIFAQLPENIQKKLNDVIFDPGITELNLSKMRLTPEVIKLIAYLLPFTTITTLNVSYNHIGDKGAGYLAKNNTITTLNVSHNDIGAKGAGYLARLNKTITTLDLSHNHIGSGLTISCLLCYESYEDDDNAYCEEGFGSLFMNKTITALNVSHNRISDEDVVIAQFLLRKNKTITTLNMSHNDIGDREAGHLAKNNTITTLNVSDNHIGDKGAGYLAKNNTITTLNVSRNFISYEARKAISTMIKRNKKAKADKLSHSIAKIMAQAMRTAQYDKDSCCYLGALDPVLLETIKNLAVGSDTEIEKPRSLEVEDVYNVHQLFNEGGKIQNWIKKYRQYQTNLITYDAYVIIKQIFEDYSKASDSSMSSKISRFFAGHPNRHHAEDVRLLLCSEEYKDNNFDQEVLTGFLTDLKQNIKDKKINEEGDLAAILTIVCKLTGINFETLSVPHGAEVKEEEFKPGTSS